MTKPEVLFSTDSGSSPVGSAAMLTTSVVSARAATLPAANASPAAQASIKDRLIRRLLSILSMPHCSGDAAERNAGDAMGPMERSGSLLALDVFGIPAGELDR